MNLNLMTTFYPSGYGIAGYHIFKTLYDLGHPISLFLWTDHSLPWADADAVLAARRNARFYDDRAACLKIHHQYVLAERIGKGKFLAYSFFELDPLASVDVHHMNRTDTMVVASRWAADVCRRSGVTAPIAVVPLGVDSVVFSPPSQPPPPSRPCIFLNVGKWEVRKGHEVLIRAFDATFGEADRVELWMMPNHYPLPADMKERWYGLYRDSKTGQLGRIKIGNPVNSHAELAEIMRMATCGVFPSFAEGFNLELLEMMACGKPVITTNYSAHTEFCTPQNSMLIEGSKLTPARDGQFFDGDAGNWLSWEEAQTDQLCAHLRAVYNRFAAGENLLNSPGLETARQFSWSATAQRIIEAVLA